MMRQVCSRFLLSFRRPVGRLVSRARACACRLLVLLLGFVCDFFRLTVFWLALGPAAVATASCTFRGGGAPWVLRGFSARLEGTVWPLLS